MPGTERTSEAAAALSQVDYFAGLDPATLEVVGRAALRREFQADQIVLLEGEPCDGLYVIQEGWLKAVKLSPEGREQVLRFLGPGETFNVISVLRETPNPATVVALEPVTAWVVRREAMLQLLDDEPRLARMVIQNLAERILHLVGLVEDLSLRTVETRLARLLLEQASEGLVRRRKWATQAEMAARLGTVPDVLHRALRGLVEAGLIAVDRQQIRVLDREGLAAKAGAGE